MRRDCCVQSQGRKKERGVKTEALVKRRHVCSHNHAYVLSVASRCSQKRDLN